MYGQYMTASCALCVCVSVCVCVCVRVCACAVPGKEKGQEGSSDAEGFPTYM